MYFCIFFHSGENSHSSSAGGGAGGSVWIETVSLQGNGLFSVSGGNGGDYGGGGSGGMLAIYYKESSLLFDFSIQGGNGRTAGAAGMIYFKHEDSTRGKLLLDNNNQKGPTSVLVCQPSQIDYIFSEIEIRRGAKLAMIPCTIKQSMSLITNKLNGDKTGSIEVGSNQYFYWQEPLTPVDLKSNIYVKHQGLLSLPRSILLSKRVNLHVKGSLVGVKNITVSTNGRLSVESPGGTGFRPNVSAFHLDTLYVRRFGIVESFSQNKAKFYLNLLKLDYGSQYGISDGVTSYRYKVVQVKGKPLNNIACPHGVVNSSSPTYHNPCGEGKWSIIYNPIPYQMVKNISQGNVYKLVLVTLYRPNYNICCDYSDFRLLPGQSCIFKPGHYKYRSLEINPEATMSFEADTERKTTNTLEVEELRIFADGSLRGLPGHWTSNLLKSTDGGTHGGFGGKSNRDKVYGDVRSPESYGSSGGGSQGYQGKGGGQLRIRVTQTFINNGLVEVNGGNAGVSGGGGSGGSLLITANELKGAGAFEANGGSSSTSYGGSGGGGRISFHINSSFDGFLGSYEAYSGNGYRRGTSGTIFIKDSDSREGSLIIKGAGTQAVVLPSNSSMLQVDSFRLLESSTFKVSVPDGSGKIVVPMGSNFNIAKLPSTNSIGCSLEISGVLVVHVPVIVNGPPIALILYGVVRTPRLTVGKNKILQWVNGLIKADELVLKQSSTVNIENISKVTINKIYVGANARLIVAKNDVSFVSQRLIFDAYSSLSSTASTKSLNITADNVQINSFASLGVTAGGYLQGPGFYGKAGIGGSHGGEAIGGKQNLVYGSAFEPFEFGSGSIDTSGAAQRGGGRLVMNIRDVLVVDGEIRANGGRSERDGGGSGGSIKITAKVLKGSGSIRSNGMKGGSGGRIAVYIIDRKDYSGEVSCYGGCGTSCCAAGTIFIKEYLVGIPYNTTIIHNSGWKSNGVTGIMHGDKTKYTLGKLRVVEEGSVEVINPNITQPVTIKILQLEGDFTGQIRVVRNQKVFLAGSSASGSQPFVLRCAINVQEGAELVLPPRVFVKETSLSPSLNVAGKVQGSQALIVGMNALVLVSSEGVIGTKSSRKGTLTFRTLDVLSGGVIAFNLGGLTPMEIRAVVINIEYNGVLKSPRVIIKTPILNVQMGGSIRADGLGHGPSKGPGAGGTLNYYGGSYGGCGGGHNSQSCPIYGSFFGSTEPGSGGGGSTGGHGGGVIVLDIDRLHLNGIISSDGGHGINKTGGGSGGSVYATIKKVFSGRGMVQARGGNAGTQGGGGGGGRIYIDARTAYNFKGDVDAKGGVGFGSGSPGTIWLLKIKDGLQTNNLVIDNKDISLSNNLPVILNESGVTIYNFDSLYLMGKIVLTPDHHMIVQHLVTSPLSTISVPDGLILDVESKLDSTSPVCNFHLATNGEIRLPSVVTFLGPENKFSGTITGVLDMIIGEGRRTELTISARTALFVDGNYTFISKRGEYKFASLLLESNAVVSFEKSELREVPLVFGTLELRYGSILRGSWLNIHANSILVHSGAKIDLVGKGYEGGRGTGKGEFIQGYGTGAGHGGVGGGTDGAGGRWHDDMTNPTALGSGGGSRYRIDGGSGGGYLHVVTSEKLIVDGSLMVSGCDCYVAGCGGGSGGTIFIKSRSFSGVGLVGSRGGNGDHAGGGGSGGRISIHLNAKMLFEGLFEVEGGSGKYLGASGTVYLEDETDSITKSKVIVNNKEKKSTIKPMTAITTNKGGNVKLEELELIGPSSVSFFVQKTGNQQMEISIAKLSAGINGEIVIQANQVMFTQTKEAQETSLILRTNLVIERNGDFVAASKLFVDGATLHVDGRLLNVRNLTLESGSSVTFSEKSQTGTYYRGFGHLYLTTPGTQLFGSLILKSGSLFNAPQNLKVNVATMVVKNGVLISVKDLQIQASTIILEQGTTLSANGVSTTGPGNGTSTGAIGSGGSYASPGGAGKSQKIVEKSYGTLYRPVTPGSPGGDGATLDSAGKGGGVIRILANLFRLDGKLTVNGGDGIQGSNAGGGSGGSIMLTVDKLIGKGVIAADGGVGDGYGGCGSGGRISIHLQDKNTFLGTIKATSGACRSLMYAAGPGTLYIREKKNKRPYTSLIIDNRDQNWNTFVTLDESKDNYDFHEVILRGGAAIQLLKQPQIHQTLNIDFLSGDNSGLIHVHANQTVTLSELTPARMPISVKVDKEGLMLLPHSVIIVGNRPYSIELSGTILGIRNMEVARDRHVKFYERASLGIGTDIIDYKVSEGTLEFGSLILHSSSQFIIDDTKTIKIIADKIDVKYNASLISFSLSLTVSRLHVEIGGRIDCSGENEVIQTKASTSNLSIGTGAGHGSDGGKGAAGQSGLYYGSLYNPSQRGQNGGAGPQGSRGGFGGGNLFIKVGTRFINDGIITVSGGNAPVGSNAGGGSGGSIKVITNSYRGFGMITVRGGRSGGSRAGSGSGGRIAVYCKTGILYRGTYEASGGTAEIHGGPGTIFLQDLKYKRVFKQLRFGNRKGENLVYVTLHESNLTEYIFSEVVIEQRTAVRLKEDGERRMLKVDKLTGDGTGYIFVGENHTFYLQGSTGHGGVSRPPVNLKIDGNGTAVLDSSVYIVSDSTASPDGHALTFNGRIVGMQHLFLTKERKVMVGGKSQTAYYINGSLINSLPGRFILATLEVHDRGNLTFVTTNGMKGLAGKIDIKYGGRILADTFEISK